MNMLLQSQKKVPVKYVHPHMAPNPPPLLNAAHTCVLKGEAMWSTRTPLRKTVSSRQEHTDTTRTFFNLVELSHNVTMLEIFGNRNSEMNYSKFLQKPSLEQQLQKDESRLHFSNESKTELIVWDLWRWSKKQIIWPLLTLINLTLNWFHWFW